MTPARHDSIATGAIDEAGARLGVMARDAGIDVTDARATQVLFDVIAGNDEAGGDDPMLSAASILAHQRRADGLAALDGLIQLRTDQLQIAADTPVQHGAGAALARAKARRSSLLADNCADERDEVTEPHRPIIERMTGVLLTLEVASTVQLAQRAAAAVASSVPLTDVEVTTIEELADHAARLPDARDLTIRMAGLLTDVIAAREHHRGLAEKETAWAAGRLLDAGARQIILVRTVPWFSRMRYLRALAKAPVLLPQNLYPGDPHAVYVAAAARLAHSSDALQRAEDARGKLIMRMIRGEFPGLLAGAGTRHKQNVVISSAFGLGPTAINYWRRKVRTSS